MINNIMDDHLIVQSADAMELSLPVAGIGSRSYAFIIDWIICSVLSIAWMIAVFMIARVVRGGDVDLFSGSIWTDIATWPAMIFFFLYHPIFEISMKGRTPGKRMAGIRVVSLDGRTPTTSAIIVRNVFRLIDCQPALFYLVGLATCIFSKRSVRIGDMAAGTVLVDEVRVTDKALEQVGSLAMNSNYTPEQMDILQVLIGRWRSLMPAVRVKLAEKLLQTLAVELPEQRAGHVYGNMLLERLKATQRGEKL